MAVVDAARGNGCSNSRIDNLDVLRGVAILGILFINLPGAATYFTAFFGLEPLAGWSRLDQIAWATKEIFIDGTQKGLLQLLFGAGMLILTAKAMADDGPVIVADTYYRRNLWLMLFGLANVFLLLFPGDILFIYAIAALFLFPFRKLSPNTLLLLGLLWTAYASVEGATRYAERTKLTQQVQVAQQAQATGLMLTQADRAALKTWSELKAEFKPDPKELATDRSKRFAPFGEYAAYMQGVWLDGRAKSLFIFLHDIPEAFCFMLIGAALFKWGIIQGSRRRKFYLIMLAGAYGVGLSLRIVEVQQHLTYAPVPRVVWFTNDIARLAMTFGHLALINLVLSHPAGQRLLSPFRAAGRTAFSLYVMQTLLTMWLLFPGFGLGLWGQFGWAGMFSVAVTIIVGQLVLANIWLRYFGMGPVEWLWRSLVYMKVQPFRKRPSRVPALTA